MKTEESKHSCIMLKNILLSLFAVSALLTISACANSSPIQQQEPVQADEQFSCKIDADCVWCACKAATECVNLDWWEKTYGKDMDCICDPGQCKCFQEKCTNK